MSHRPKIHKWPKALCLLLASSLLAAALGGCAAGGGSADTQAPETAPPVTEAATAPPVTEAATAPVETEAVVTPVDYGDARIGAPQLPDEQDDPLSGYTDEECAEALDGIGEFLRRTTPVFLGEFGDDNAVCSPLNLYLALSMLAEAAEGETRQEILTALGCDTIEQVRTRAGILWNSCYGEYEPYQCLLANSLWLDDRLLYDQDTVDTLAGKHYASVFRGPLSSGKMDGLLHSWLNEQTNNLLKEMADGITLEDAVFALASTLYYKDSWQTAFQKENNLEDVFHSPAGDTAVTYLCGHQTAADYRYGSHFRAVAWRLTNGKMWLILPDEGYTPADLLAEGEALEMVTTQPYDWRGTQRGQYSIPMDLQLPKFDVSCRIDLKSGMSALGMESAFLPGAADFSGLVPGKGCVLSQAVHAARLRIDEDGAEGAAFTVFVGMGYAGEQPPENLVFDRPFLFVVATGADVPLFVGVVSQP